MRVTPGTSIDLDELTRQRRRRYYKLTAEGRKVLAAQRNTRQEFFAALDRVARITPDTEDA